MDLKIKGKTWAGSIFRKFEAMCQDVDDFVNKDTVRYVGNQVQNVGVGVKKMYLDAVQDLLPPVDKAQVMTEKQSDVIGTCVRSIEGIKEKTLCDIDEKSRKQNVIDLLEHCSSSLSCEADPERQFLSPRSADPSEEAVTTLVSKQDFGAAVYENLDVSVAKNVAGEEQLVSSSGDRNFSESSLYSTDLHYIHTTLPEVSSLISLMSCEPEMERKFFCPLGANPSKEAEIDLLFELDGGPALYENSNISIDKNVASEEQPVAENRSYFEHGNRPELTLHLTDHYLTDTAEVSQPVSLMSCEPDPERQFLLPLGANPSKEAARDLVLEHNGDAAVNENSDISIVKNVASEEAVTENISYSEDRNFCYSSLNSIDHYHIDTTLPEVSSRVPLMCSEPDPQRQFLCPPGVIPYEESKTDFVVEHVDGGAINESSVISIDKNVASEEQPVVENRSYSEDGSFSESSQNSTDHYCIGTTLPEVSSRVSLHESGYKSHVEDRTIHNILSSGLQFSEISCDHGVARPEVTSSRISPSTEPVNMSDSFYPNSTQISENLCWSYSDTVGHASNMSNISYSASGPILANHNKDGSMLSSISNSLFSSESNDAYSNHGLSFVVGSSDSRNEQCSESVPLKAPISSSLVGEMDDSIEDVSDPSMETIDLSDKIKVNESCEAVDNRLIFPVSSGARSFRSYKKLLKDAFGLRKRLTKEYEQLAIWYGDIDEEASHHFERPPSPRATSIHLPKSPTQDIWESEWELL